MPMDEKELFDLLNQEKAPPSEEDFRPIIPEPEIRRRSAYYFRRDYPETDSPTSTHTITFAQQERRRKNRNRVLYALLLLAVFTLIFVITATCMKISQQPI